MPITTVRFSPRFADKHVLYQHPHDNQASARLIERERHHRLAPMREKFGIGPDTNSTSIIIDSVDRQQVILDSIRDELNRDERQLGLAANDYVTVGVNLPTQMNISATQAQGDRGDYSLCGATYARLGGVVRAEAGGLIFEIIHFDELAGDPIGLRPINNGVGRNLQGARRTAQNLAALTALGR